MSSSKHKARRRDERDAVEGTSAALDKRRTRNVALAGIATFLAVGGIAAALVASSGDSSSSSNPAAQVDTTGLPTQLVANAKDANRVVDGGIAAKLEELRGVPVVVNQWASWCPSCKAEFGYFAELAKTYRDKVAFVGLDAQDERGKAEDFLTKHPVPFPSLFDRSAGESVSIGAGQSWPTTVFFNAEGERTFVRPGGYTTVEALDNDIRLYALEGSS